jgi:hypothetical protein
MTGTGSSFPFRRTVENGWIAPKAVIRRHRRERRFMARNSRWPFTSYGLKPSKSGLSTTQDICALLLQRWDIPMLSEFARAIASLQAGFVSTFAADHLEVPAVTGPGSDPTSVDEPSSWR